MIRRGEDPDIVPDDEMRLLLRTYLKNLKLHVKKKPNMDVCYISYNDLMTDPDLSIDEIDDLFGGSLDKEAMRKSIDKSLYRNRK